MRSLTYSSANCLSRSVLVAARLTFRARKKMNIKSFPLKRRINRFEKNIPPNSIEIAQNNNYFRVIVVETFFVKKYFVCVESS